MRSAVVILLLGAFASTLAADEIADLVKKIDGFWFPTKLTQNGAVLFTLEEIRVDKGVDDAVFEEAKPGK